MSNNIIYSSNFKKWFGDWEHNPNASSKVVDENGMPLLVYHGSESVFDEFKSEFMGKTGTACGQGFYFTNDKNEASYFGNNVKTFFLNIRKPLSDESLTITSDMFRILLDSIDKKQCEADADFGYGILSDYGDVDYYGRESVLNDAVEMEINSSDNDVELIGGIVNATNDYDLVMQTLRDTLGYDGVIIKSRGVFVAHHPNQIKEIGNTEFSNSNNMYEGIKSRKIYITESQYNVLLNESQESKSIDAAKKLLMNNGYTPEQADKFVRINLRSDIPILRTPQGGKFILGCTRMFLNRELSSADVILNLNKTLKLLISAHYNEYDRNLNNLSAEELVNRFADARSEDSSNRRKELDNFKGGNYNYKIVPINSFEEASKYSGYTSWCVTHGKGAFDSYTAGGEAQFYFCLKNGFENIKPIKGNNCPLDEYGLSMLAVCVDGEGDLKTCTCRWNHDNRGNDSILNEKQISEIVGVNFYEVFKPNNVLASKIEALKGMTEIPNNYFENSKIKEIVIPNNITSIGDYAFVFCDSLTSVTIPDSVTSIGERAFYCCKSLKEVTIGNSVTSIGCDAFYECYSLTSVIIPDSVTEIGTGTFYRCIRLTSVTIGNSVTEIGNAAFGHCKSLKEATIPNSTTSIGSCAFYNCSRLTSVTIGNSVTSIGYEAFAYCNDLKKVIASSRFVEYFKEKYNIDIIPNDKGGMHESIGRNIYITESQYKMLTENYNFIDTEKVLIVKKYLDKYFTRGSMNKLSDSGYVVKVGVIGMKNNDGEVIKNLTALQMLDLLEDKFHHIYDDNEKRTKFLKQVLKDWCNKKISKEGMLSVNFY